MIHPGSRWGNPPGDWVDCIITPPVDPELAEAMLAPALHQLIDCLHALTGRAGLPGLDRAFPLVVLGVIALVTLLVALRHGQTSRS